MSITATRTVELPVGDTTGVVLKPQASGALISASSVPSVCPLLLSPQRRPTPGGEEPSRTL